MKIKELRQKSKKELELLVVADREKLMKLKFDLKSKKLKNVKELKETRREIARVLTLLKDKK